MIAKIYLNESRDSFSGYDPENAELHLAQKVELPDGIPSHHTLEFLFEQLNVGTELKWVKEYRKNGNRSLSVGDVVLLGYSFQDPQAYAVGRWGWDEVSEQDFLAGKSRGATEGSSIQ